MITLLITLELISAVGLIVMVLLHSAKGEGLGAMGSPARLFDTHKDMESGLNKLTGALAGIFLVCAGILSVLS